MEAWVRLIVALWSFAEEDILAASQNHDYNISDVQFDAYYLFRRGLLARCSKSEGR